MFDTSGVLAPIATRGQLNAPWRAGVERRATAGSPHRRKAAASVSR